MIYSRVPFQCRKRFTGNRCTWIKLEMFHFLRGQLTPSLLRLRAQNRRIIRHRSGQTYFPGASQNRLPARISFGNEWVFKIIRSVSFWLRSADFAVNFALKHRRVRSQVFWPWRLFVFVKLQWIPIVYAIRRRRFIVVAIRSNTNKHFRAVGHSFFEH